jgi:hypothetical protein
MPMTFAECRSWSGAAARLAVSDAGLSARQHSSKAGKRCDTNDSLFTIFSFGSGLPQAFHRDLSDVAKTKGWASSTSGLSHSSES